MTFSLFMDRTGLSVLQKHDAREYSAVFSNTPEVGERGGPRR